MRKDYYQPSTVASCVTDVAKNDSEQRPLQFARLSEIIKYEDREIVSIDDLTKNKFIKKISDDNSSFSVDRIDLPQDFNTGIPGAVIVDHRNLNGSSYNITTCTLNAGWGSSGLTTNTLQPGVISSYLLNIPPSWL